MARKRPITLEDLFHIKAVGKVCMSPDGSKIAFELKRFDLAENRNFVQIMLADAATGRVRALTTGHHNDHDPQWAPDGEYLAFISDRVKGASLWVLPMGGGEPRRITDRDGFVHDFSWSPDGRRLAYAFQAMSPRQKLERDETPKELKKRPQFKHITRLWHKLDGAGWWNGEYVHIWSVSADGKRPRQLTFGDTDDVEPRFSPNGKLISFISNRVPDPDMDIENSDIFVIPAGGGRTRKVTRGPGHCSGHSWSPDGGTIAYVGSPAKTGDGLKYNEHVWLVPAAGGAPRELTRELDNSCRNATLGDVTGAGFQTLAPMWSADGSRVHFAVSEGGAVRLYSRSVRRPDLRCEVGGEINLLFAHAARPGGPMALSIGTSTNPGDIFVADPAAGFKLRQLSRVNEEVFDRVEVSRPEPFQVRSGRAVVHGWVIKPPRFNSARKYPAILEIHGGPHAQYGHSFMHEMQLMAARGFVVVLCNPRGSVGYGLKHMNCISEDWGNLDYKDCMRATDWMCSRSYVNRARVGVTGGSYGGYMTNWLVGHTDRFKAAVTQRSVVNLESMFGTSDFGYHMGREFGGMPWKGVEALRRQSPLKYVARMRTPLLIEHEEEDHRCPIEQAEQLFTALKGLGQEVELVRFEGESHGLSRGGRPQNRAERLRRILGWFEKRL